MKKKKSPPIRKRKLDIKNEANRTMEQKGFDDMAAIMLGDESKLIHTQPSRISEQDTQSSGSFYEIIKKEDAYNRRLKLILGIVLVVSVSLILGISMFIKKGRIRRRIYRQTRNYSLPLRDSKKS